jgi:hypothetical protein
MLAKSDRLRPVVVPTRRGEDQFLRILETLARTEMTDGLTLAQLIVETSPRLPHDATVLAIVSRVTEEDAIALGSLRRQGFAVEAVVNTYEELDYSKMAGLLWAEGVPARHLKNEEVLVQLCEQTGVGVG